MSLMEFLDVRDGALVPSYREVLLPIRCDWCEEKADSVAGTGASWICPDCIGRMREQLYESRRISRRGW